MIFITNKYYLLIALSNYMYFLILIITIKDDWLYLIKLNV
jgi:hypothetical protein